MNPHYARWFKNAFDNYHEQIKTIDDRMDSILNLIEGISMGTTLPENQQQIADNLYTVIKILSQRIPYVLEGELFGRNPGKQISSWDDDVGIAVPAELF